MNEKLLYLCSAWLSRCIRLVGGSKKDFDRILVVKLDEIGDLVTSLNAMYLLQHRYPKARIEVHCKPFNHIFFRHTDIEAVDRPTGKYDLIVDLRGDWSSLWYAIRHWPRWRLDRGAIRMRNKFSGGQTNELITNHRVVQPLVGSPEDRYANPIRTAASEEQRVDEFIRVHGLNRYVVLHLGARDAIRRWPVDRYAQVISNLLDMGYRCVLAGGPSDRELNAACLPDAEGVLNAAGELDLLEFTVLCRKADLFIGNESGPLHIASAAGTPVIGLFGPGVKDVFYPMGDRVRIHHYFLDKGHKRQDASNTTINRITVNEVMQSVKTLLDG